MRARELVDCIRRKLGRVSGLHSLILYGSLVRGDFIPGTSDIDFFVVLEIGANPDSVLRKVRPVLEECSSPFKPIEVDVAWEWLQNLSDPLNLGYPYKFLTIYQRDFRENHLVVIGNDILELLPDYELSQVLPDRLNAMERNLERFAENRKMLHILAGETARLLAFLSGSTLRKDEVIHTLMKLNDTDAVRIFQGYLQGRKEEFDETFLRAFVVSRIEKLRKEISVSSKPLSQPKGVHPRERRKSS